MIKLFKNIKKWAVENPKKFYKYAVIFLFLLVIINIYLEVFVYSKSKTIFGLPSFYKNSSAVIRNTENKQKRLDEISKEVQVLKNKREQGLLTPNDSLRIEYLYHQYQIIKNEKEN